MYGCDQTVTLTHLHYDGDADRDVKEETTLLSPVPCRQFTGFFHIRLQRCRCRKTTGDMS